MLRSLVSGTATWRVFLAKAETGGVIYRVEVRKVKARVEG
jgi:hypothetical protein